MKGFTGITLNVSAHITLFHSIESDSRYQGQEAKLDSSLVPDKYTWLGETGEVTELLLKIYYPELGTKEYQQAWAAHVEDGIAALRNHKHLLGFSTNI